MKHLVIGSVAVILGLSGLIAWWPTFGLVMRGVIPFTVLMFGIVALYSGTRRVFGAKAAVEAQEELREAKKSAA
jgi:hypothetical protein